MSYILEALKQAEEERGSDRLSKVLSAQPVEEPHQNSVNWKKWLTIAIFINAVVLFVWVAWKLLGITTDTAVNNQSIQSESRVAAGATTATKEPTETLSSFSAEIATQSPIATRSSANATITPEKKVPAIAKPAEPQPPTVVSEPVQAPSLPPVEIAEPQTVPAVEEKTVPSEITPAKVEKPKSSSAKLEQAIALEKTSPAPPTTKSDKLVATAPVIKAEINPPKVEPLPATPREQLAIETEQVETQPKPEIIEPEVAEPIVVEQIAVVQRPPVPEFAELPYSLQQQIPEIRISVHIFNSEPQQRKVRINGRIFREGEEVARNLWVEEITPRGVIFDYDQTVFRLNLH